VGEGCLGARRGGRGDAASLNATRLLPDVLESRLPAVRFLGGWWWCLMGRAACGCCWLDEGRGWWLPN
jgi:hypothetical protein